MPWLFLPRVIRVVDERVLTRSLGCAKASKTLSLKEVSRRAYNDTKSRGKMCTTYT